VESSAATITLATSTFKRTIFVIHGIDQSNDDVRALTSRLRTDLPAEAYDVDGGFDYSDCAKDRNCPGDCSMPEIARRLNNYIKNSRPSDRVILIGYSLGGLVARHMLFEFSRSFADIEIDGLITLGTPNLGYPFARIDLEHRCRSLLMSMASFYYQREADSEANHLAYQSPAMSPYLAWLNYGWAHASFRSRPKRWLAIAGAYCSSPTRVLGENGCKDNDRSDGVVCRSSALADFEAFNDDRSIERTEFDDFAHSDPPLWKALLFPCGSDQAPTGYLFDPERDSGVFRRMLLFIRGL
jgi:pimeloyl-ACP methyl ester carboxylesterase